MSKSLVRTADRCTSTFESRTMRFRGGSWSQFNEGPDRGLYVQPACFESATENMLQTASWHFNKLCARYCSGTVMWVPSLSPTKSDEHQARCVDSSGAHHCNILAQRWSPCTVCRRSFGRPPRASPRSPSAPGFGAFLDRLRGVGSCCCGSENM